MRDRRRFMKLLSAGAILRFAWALPEIAWASDAVPLLETDAAAKTLGYVQDARSTASAGNNCASCSLFQGETKAVQGPCQLFPGKLVKAAGWCSAWAPQM